MTLGLVDAYGGLTRTRETNYILNSAFEVQRRPYTSGAIIVSPGGTKIDRWYIDAGDVSLQTYLYTSPSNGSPTYTSSFYMKALGSASGGSVLFGALQCVEKPIALKNKICTLSAWVKTNKADVLLMLKDFASVLSSVTHTGDGTWQLLKTTKLIPDDTYPLSADDATTSIYSLKCGVCSPIGATINTDDYIEFTAMQLTEGQNILPYKRAGQTLHEEVALCGRYYESISAGGNTLNRYYTANADVDSNFIITIPYHYPKAIKPITAGNISLFEYSTSFNKGAWVSYSSRTTDTSLWGLNTVQFNLKDYPNPTTTGYVVFKTNSYYCDAEINVNF